MNCKASLLFCRIHISLKRILEPAHEQRFRKPAGLEGPRRRRSVAAGIDDHQCDSAAVELLNRAVSHGEFPGSPPRLRNFLDVVLLIRLLAQDVIALAFCSPRNTHADYERPGGGTDQE